MKDVAELKLYVIAGDNGDLIAVDSASGGYPWVPTVFQDVRLWNSVEEAANYIAVIQWRDPNHKWKIRVLNLSLSDISVDEETIQKHVWINRNGGTPEQIQTN